MSNNQKIISFVGLSGSGKTTLLERLIRELKWRGFRVGTIKHSSHTHPMDMPGKDSWRHREAGAERTLFVGPTSMQFVATLAEPPTPASLAGEYLAGLDIVLVEGFLTEEGPKVEIVRGERSKHPVCTVNDGLVAVMSDLSAKELGNPGVPVIDINDVESLADFLVKRFALVAPQAKAEG
jgi:molybdopterin-guanine dinucleotide biosynthesis protein B